MRLKEIIEDFFIVAIVAAIIALVLFGCSDEPSWKEKRQDAKLKFFTEGYDYDTFYVVTIDDCEYVVYHGSQKGSIIHKANCKNVGHTTKE